MDKSRKFCLESILPSSSTAAVPVRSARSSSVIEYEKFDLSFNLTSLITTAPVSNSSP